MSVKISFVYYFFGGSESENVEAGENFDQINF